MITYETRVFSDGKYIGTIRRVKEFIEVRFQYFPKGQKEGGELFKTLTACQNSL